MTKVLLVALFLLVSCMVVACAPTSSSNLHPVVLIPALLGSQIEMRLNRTTTGHWWCPKQKDWFFAYLNNDEYLPFLEECFVENFGLQYSAAEHLCSDPAGVETRLPNYGNVESVEFLDQKQKTPVYHWLISNLTEAGYQRNVNLRAAPYDWRFGPNQWRENFALLRKLIEQTYMDNGNRSVILISLSMGGPYSSLFLSQQEQEWKDQYVRFWYSLSGVFSGSANAIFSIVTLEHLPFFMSKHGLQQLARTLGSNMWLVPSERAFAGNRVWVTAAGVQYTTRDLGRMLTDFNLSTNSAMLEDVQDYDCTKPPGVEVHCSYGYNVSTDSEYVFKNFDLDESPKVIHGDGDGVVLTESLQVCAGWAQQQQQSVFVYRQPNVYHAYDLFLPDSVARIVQTCLAA